MPERQPVGMCRRLARMRSRRSIRGASLPVIGLLLAACQAVPGIPIGAPLVDADGDWTLRQGIVDGAAIPLPPDGRVTLLVDGEQIGGTSGCNAYGGTWSVVDGRLVVAGLGGTEMACAEPLMALEQSYLAALLRIDRAVGAGGALALSGPGVELRFERQVPAPVPALIGTSWRLESLLEGEVARSTVGPMANLTFDADGSVRGSTGCRAFVGRYRVNGDAIVVTDLAADTVACPADLAEQDGFILGTLEGDTIPTVDAGGLTLLDAAGDGLHYRVDEGTG